MCVWASLKLNVLNTKRASMQQRQERVQFLIGNTKLNEKRLWTQTNVKWVRNIQILERQSDSTDSLMCLSALWFGTKCNSFFHGPRYTFPQNEKRGDKQTCKLETHKTIWKHDLRGGGNTLWTSDQGGFTGVCFRYFLHHRIGCRTLNTWRDKTKFSLWM